MEWYYVENGQQVGPVSESTLDILVKAGTVTDSTLVWRQGLAAWTPYSKARPEGPSRPGPAPAPAGVGGTGPGEAVTGAPAAARRAAALDYAGFWRRFTAKFIDGALLWGAGMLIQFAAEPFVGPLGDDFTGRDMMGHGIVGLLQLVVGVAYTTWFVGRSGATPGKKALGLRIVRPDGGPVSYERAFGRYFAEILSGLLLGIGYLIAAFDAERRTLHDRLCDTRVINIS